MQKFSVKKYLYGETENLGQPFPHRVGGMRPPLKDIAEMRNWAADLLGHLRGGEFKDRHLTARDPLASIRESHVEVARGSVTRWVHLECAFVLGFVDASRHSFA